MSGYSYTRTLTGIIDRENLSTNPWDATPQIPRLARKSDFDKSGHADGKPIHPSSFLSSVHHSYLAGKTDESVSLVGRSEYLLFFKGDATRLRL